MIVDSSALLAIILDEVEASAFTAAILADLAPKMSAVSYLEVALKVDRTVGGADPALDAAIGDLGIALVPLTVAQAHVARAAFNRFGQQHPARLNFGDCLVYALARTSGEPLLFKGNDFSHTDLASAVLPAGKSEYGRP